MTELARNCLKPIRTCQCRGDAFRKSARLKLHMIEDFCTDHLSPVPGDLERDGLDSLVQAFLSARTDTGYTSLCELLNTLSERTGTQKQLVVVR